MPAVMELCGWNATKTGRTSDIQSSRGRGSESLISTDRWLSESARGEKTVESENYIGVSYNCFHP